MLTVYLSGILIVGGLLTIGPLPFVGMLILGLGCWLFLQTTTAQRSEASSFFFALGLLGLVTTFLAGLWDVVTSWFS